MNLAIGTKVRWESAAGVKRGTIKNIVLGPAANNRVTPWIDVESLVQISDMYRLRSVRLCASDSNLKAMRVALVA
jgi:L-arabinose isomerase